jgi:rhodanese-related sulfurtransferase
MEHSPGFLAHVEGRRARVTEVSVADAVSAMEETPGARLLDVREDREFAAAHARGAEHVARGVLERDIERLVPDVETPVYLYCGGGFRSALAAIALQEMGYRRVYSVAGGWRAWHEAQAPIVAPSSPLAAVAALLREAGHHVTQHDDGHLAVDVMGTTLTVRA